MKIFALVVFAVAISGAKLFAAQSNIEKRDHVLVSLVSSHKTVARNQKSSIALKFLIDKDWHIYWKNPGDSGTAPRIEWLKKDNLEISSFNWPTPYPIPVGPLTNYGYEKEVVLPMDVQFSGEKFSAAGKASWLVCKIECIPGEAELKLEIPVGEVSELSQFSSDIENAISKNPLKVHDVSLEMSQSPTQFELKFSSRDLNFESFEKISFFPEDGSFISHAAPQPVNLDKNNIKMTLTKSDYISSSPASIAGILVLEKLGEPRLSFWTMSTEADSAMPYWLALISAFLGGVILNLMPCVFPVISIKILGFVESSDKTDSQISSHGWMYTFGVLISFLILGAVLLLLRSLGESLGWGFQLQSPYFVIFMITLFFLLSLNLLGYFEVGQSLVGVGANVSRQNNYSGSFYTGVLATLVATPCTAPFMGSALGFAITLPPIQSIIIFISLGFGMASPYLFLSYFPNLIKKLPRPGSWMKTFKEVLAFPMLLTAVWLLWVLSLQVQAEVLIFLLVFLLAVFCVIWMLKTFRVKTASAKFIKAIFAIVIILVSGYWLVKEVRASNPLAANSNGDHWIAYSDERLKALQSEGKPVFIDFTAAWCITCQVNKKMVLNTPDIQAAFKESGVVLLKADWTNQDAEITKALSRFQRNSVPLYVLYTKDKDAKPLVLPEILTKSIVLENLNKL